MIKLVSHCTVKEGHLALYRYLLLIYIDLLFVEYVFWLLH